MSPSELARLPAFDDFDEMDIAVKKAIVADEQAGRVLADAGKLCRRVEEWCDEQDRRRSG